MGTVDPDAQAVAGALKDELSLNAAAEGIRNFLKGIGEDPKREGLVDTPGRVIKAWEEMTSGYLEDPKAILSTAFKEQYDEMVVVRQVPFESLCEHHLLAFVGRCTVGYIPDGRVVGLSKIPRVIQAFARRLQIQERLTTEIANSIESHLRPKGVGVVVEAHHSCMSLRGAKSPGAMVTSCLLGCMRDGPARDEFLGLVKEAR